MADEQGVVYISKAGRYYSAPQIDASTLYDTLQDGYIREQIDKASSKIFNGMYELTVRDENGDEDEDVSKEMRLMVETPGVLLWARMKQAWEDIVSWGPALMFPVWKKDGNLVKLMELRRLPPESFTTAPTITTSIYGEILQGIVLNEDWELEFYQIQSDLDTTPQKLKDGVLLLKDPASTGLAGRSLIIPLVPIVAMIAFAWEAQMQKVNRIGAPIMFIKLAANHSVEDEEYAQDILNNWGKGKAYQLRDNMELVGLEVKDTEAALATISELKKRLEAPFRAGSTLDKEGATIGGNAAAQKEVEDDWIYGQRTMIEDLFEGVLQKYLDINGYGGYTLEIQIAVEQAIPGTLEKDQAIAGFQTGSLSINEIRKRLGETELDDKGIETLLDEVAKLKKALGGTSPIPAEDEPAPGENPFGIPLDQVKQNAEVLKTVEEVSPLDTEAFLTNKEKRRFLGVRERKKAKT